MDMKKSTLLITLILLLASCQSAPSAATPMPAPTETATSTPELFDQTQGTPSPVLATATPALPTEIPSPTPISERVWPVDGMMQVQIPAGILHMGAFDVNANEDEKPGHEVIMDSFWMDKLEVTNGMYTLCIQAGTCSKEHSLFSQSRPDYFINPEYRDYPVVNVSWEEAMIYCKWAGRRLPSEAEWERAARGDDLRTYPWGYEPPSEKYANFNNIVHDTSRVGSYSAGASPYGVLDMAGNVWEWVDDLYAEKYYIKASTSNPVGPTQVFGKYLRTIRGGSYQDTFMDIRVSNRGSLLGPNLLALASDPSRYGQSSVKIGFRCAAGN
jgi:formylglycine-generating enzyme required for sulfatase activity